MNTKHTPGPWRLGLIGTPHGQGRAIYGSTGELVANLSADLLPDNEQLPNAKLIAAAPDLLETLQRIAALSHSGGLNIATLTTMAREAIAKATT